MRLALCLTAVFIIASINLSFGAAEKCFPWPTCRDDNPLPSWDQDQSDVSFGCDHTAFEDDPDLTVTVETSGGPILVQAMVQVIMARNNGIDIRVKVDGATENYPSRKFIGEINGEQATVHYTRMFFVNSGIHDIRLQQSCQGSPTVSKRSLTAFEVK